MPRPKSESLNGGIPEPPSPKPLCFGFRGGFRVYCRPLCFGLRVILKKELLVRKLRIL